MSETPALRPLVSVIMPNRNHALYLPSAIDGVLTQTWPELELIVLDDASSDDSRDVIRRAGEKDGRIKLIPLDTHQGIHRAVQIGVGAATGEFVYIAAADDRIERNFLERCVHEMERAPQAGLSFSDPSEFHETGEKNTFPLYLSKEPLHLNPDQLITLLSRNYFHISPNTGICRLSAFRNAGGYRHELDLLSDWFVTNVIAMRHGVVYLPEKLTSLNVRRDSYSATALQNKNRRRTAFGYVMALLWRPEYRDVALRLRKAALLPAYQFETLFWLIGSPGGRRLITPRLVARIVVRASWSYLRRHAPVHWRKTMRKYMSLWGRSSYSTKTPSQHS